jgi:hypothetical protein
MPKYANTQQLTTMVTLVQWQTSTRTQTDMPSSAWLEDEKVKRSKGIRKSSRHRRSKPRSNGWNVTPIEQFFALPERAREIQIAVANGVSLMRSDNLSAAAAARATGISPGVLKRRGRSALQKLQNGRYAANPHDDLARVVIVVSESKGPVEVATRDSRQASKAGKHSAAVQRYLETGDDSALRRLPRNYIIDAEGNRVDLLTDLDELDRLGSAGELSFESLYVRSR